MSFVGCKAMRRETGVDGLWQACAGESVYAGSVWALGATESDALKYGALCGHAYKVRGQP